ncbi:MAG: hypothetical protein SOW46_10480, partial [Candidatus Aphodomonas sp.]|nr:hypothetical protein [Candidatus Aphodomonas sp.]
PQHDGDDAHELQKVNPVQSASAHLAASLPRYLTTKQCKWKAGNASFFARPPLRALPRGANHGILNPTKLCHNEIK